MEMKPDIQQLTIEAKNGLYVAHFLPGRMEGWGVGDINKASNRTEAEERELAQAVIDSIEPIDEAELPYSNCTDGRFPEKLANGQPVPVRETVVGTDTMTAFHMAEALGTRFYQDPKAPLTQRLTEVVAFLKSNGLMPGTHISCGGAAGYISIIENAIEFSNNAGYVGRQALLVPSDAMDDLLRPQIIEGYGDRLDQGCYAGWSDQLVLRVIQDEVGDNAIAHLRDDGRGVHGHMEAMIGRINVAGAALNVKALAERTGGQQAFTINNNRLAMLANLFGRGHDEDYKIAYMAGEDFTDAGHGTLATNLPTILIEAA